MLLSEYNFNTEEILEDFISNYINVEEEENSVEYAVKYSTAATGSCMYGCFGCASTLACN